MKLFQTLSVPTMIWGLIYGSFFRSDFAISFVIASERLYGYFGLSMIFWRNQLFTGLYLAAKENIRKKDF